MTNDAQFLNLLIHRKFLTEAEARTVHGLFKDNLFGLILHLVDRNPNRKQELGRIWADNVGTVYLDLSRTLIQYHLLARLPEEFARKNLIMPVYEFGGAITVVTPSPSDKAALAEAENYLDAFVSPTFGFPDQIKDQLEIGYQTEATLSKMLDKTQITAMMQSKQGPISVEELRKMSGDEAITKFTRGLMILALKQRASDIHIEPGEQTVRVRFRIDGVLQEIFHLESAMLPPVVTRLKVIAGCDISERRQPQDGSLKLNLAERSVDMRFSSMPTIYGEKIVLRILGSSGFQSVPPLKQLGFSQTILRGISRILGTPSGVFLITGPTGSGKTTTLYSMLHHLNSNDVNIITIEDPVEYRLPGLNQIQVNLAQGITFASILRASLRQDPDIILIGEIRDLETSQIATRAALTGHTVLATLHATGTVEVITRLLDLGVEPYLLAPSLNGVMTQRLVRRLCENCKERYLLTPAESEKYFLLDRPQDVYFGRAKGCELCNKIGYLGRMAIQELLLVDDDMRSMIGQRAPISTIREHAEKGGLQSLRYDGMKKVLRGLTTIDEVDRVTIAEM